MILIRLLRFSSGEVAGGAIGEVMLSGREVVHVADVESEASIPGQERLEFI